MMRTPHSNHAVLFLSFGIQHEFSHGITSEVAYVGKHGADMQFKGDLNQVPVQNLSPDDNPTGRPYPQVPIDRRKHLQRGFELQLAAGASEERLAIWTCV